ncbi:MAG: hypothetical protein ABI361_09030 [Nitrososphaera sp.]
MRNLQSKRKKIQIIGSGAGAAVALFLVIATFSFHFSQSAAAQAGGNASAFTSADIDFASNVELVKAHLSQAVADKKQGDSGLATSQVSEALTERYSAILEPRIQAVDSGLNSTLMQGLANLAGAVNSSSLEEFSSSVQKISYQLDSARLKVLPPGVSSDARFNASVSSGIVSKASGEYKEAVTAAGHIGEQFEYRNARAFAESAEAVFNSTSFAGNSSVSALFSKLKSDMASVGDPSLVGADAGALAQALNNLAGNGVQGATNPDEATVGYVEKTRAALDDALKAYRAGNFTAADSLVTTGYLDNFENVEPVLVQKGAQGLKNQTEQMIRVQLRQMISDRVPADQFAAKISAVDANLDRIVTVVPEFPLGITAALAGPAIFAVIAFSRRSATSRSL